MRSPLFPTVMISGRFYVSARANLLRLIASVLLFTFTALPGFGSTVRRDSTRSPDGANLRQIGQSSLIYAQANNDRLPRATDVWNYAGLLAKEGGLGISVTWMAGAEIDRKYFPLPAILLPNGLLEPDFQKLKLAYAVPINANLSTNAPATTPIVWTRGLQPDGTWTRDSPYKGDGGYIVFIGGNVQFFKNLKGDGHGGELTRFDGKGKTANILEALPPGSRISEYVPTASERRAQEDKQFWSCILPALIAGIIWLNVTVIGVCMWNKKIMKPAPIFITLVIVTVLTVGVVIAVL